MLKQLAIIAGGMGTRLSKTVGHIPKCLVPICDRPLLDYHLEMAEGQGIEVVYIFTGHLSNQVEDFVKKRKNKLRITILKEEKPLGTAGCFNSIRSLWTKESLMVLYGDVVCSLDIQRMYQFHKSKNALSTLLTHPNNHPYDSDLIECDNNEQITKILRKPHESVEYYHNLVNAGAFIIERGILNYIEEKKADWIHDIIYKLVREKAKIFSYHSREYIKDMGTPDRLLQVQHDIKSGKVESLNLKNPRPAIFIDRDGTINEEVNNCSKLEDFKIFEFVPDSIIKANENGFLTFIITNQPVIAKGFCTEDVVILMHKKLETYLGKFHSYLDGIFYCPHHPDIGFKGEVPELKIRCKCRKPETGLIEIVKNKYNIDIKNSFFIGDSTTDITTGKTAGLKTILVKTGLAGKDHKFPNVKADFECDNLYKAIETILQEN